MHILVGQNLRAKNLGRRLNKIVSTLPDDGISRRHFKFFKQDIKGMNAMILLNNAA